MSILQNSEVSQAFGLETLRVGAHFIRTESRKGVAQQIVRGIFQLSVRPSFREACTVWIVTTQGAPSHEAMPPGRTKVAVAAKGAIAFSEMAVNPLDECLSMMNLLAYPSSGATNDGVTYEFKFQTIPVSGEFHFSNPRTETLQALARGMYAAARSVVPSTSNLAIREIVDAWGTYIEHGRH